MTAGAIIGLLTLLALAGLAGADVLSGGVAPRPGNAALATCTGAAAIDFGCHTRRYTQIVRRDGARAALGALASDQRRNGFVRAACHQLTHRIGRAAGSMHGIDAFRDGRSVCVSGYYHGVLQAVMSRSGARRAVRDAAAICDATRGGGRPSAEHYNCVHGMGHGYMEVFDSRVFESLRGCRALRDRWEQDECSGGVFMENVAAMDDPDRPSRSLRADRPLYPCTAVAPRWWKQCYEWQVTYALYVSDGDFRKVFGLCAAAAPGARQPCYRGLGGDAMQHSKFVTGERARATTIRGLCAKAPRRAARIACIEGAVHNMYRDYADGDAHARALCRAMPPASGERAACRRAESETRREVDLPEPAGG